MTYKLIAIDIDDTLLTSAKTISSQTKAQIRLALERNIKVVLCSGRPHKAMYKYAQQLGIYGTNQYMITNGGAIIENLNSDIIFQNTLPNIFYHYFVDFVDKNSLSYCVFDVNGNVYTSNHSDIDPFTIAMAFENGDGLHIRNPEEMPSNFEITKAVINGDEEKINRITNFIKAEFSDYFVVRTGIGYLEIFPNDVNKGIALKHLANHLNISLSDIIAFGDRDNDIPLLETVGLGIAMKNATVGTKAVCDYITTDNNHDGVGKALAKFV
ncbi:Cof-type HAD-IIB family hydrolase [Companilactobacillus pabuli]|jgi:Cof subfamily protein (haloacid dehalogenase superfamily)|uniref:Cof-type HAD-IIB family hydrolase n=1 Tax=Companilactobacillus pabuli TaxID=2714036 RepID=A0A7L7KWH8_9LACO|nr:Cof-type HAD-IIB family hydrolase [Companilactobacillus pabuli]AKP03814.1 haloacid dehalogenase [Companilactobacillus farciminis]AKS52119.1 haloacid dehalogenase [Companilactobacillus farciminis]MDG5113039.1 Cof-type HAD-IIB family hydrolase [Companilactobacillus pabuli]QMT84137.1 Cof-type HAD-IIB family hydrolase [Companilactobacillus pabuli]GAQ00972.1 haloacid dehalogenase [Companilactobacillus farciminis]